MATACCICMRDQCCPNGKMKNMNLESSHMFEVANNKYFRKISLGICLILLSWIVTGASSIENHVQATPTTYDLLFWSGLPTSYNPDEIVLNHVNTETGVVTRLPIQNEYPAGFFALSPDTQHLIIFKAGHLCSVDRKWQTEFCYSLDVPDLFYDHIYWSPDSLSFWAIRTHDPVIAVSLIQISALDGTVLSEITVQDEDFPGRSAGLSIVDFSPERMVAVVYDSGEKTYVYDLETKEALYSSSGLIRDFSPDTQWILERGGFLISRLDGAPEIYINPDIAWSTDPDLVWESAVPRSRPRWSHDGRMIAYRHWLLSRESPEPLVTIVYFLDTHEMRLIAATEVYNINAGWIIWSPDDQVIAQVNCPSTYNGCDLSIVTLDVEEQILVSGVSDDPAIRQNIMSATWIPRGWLQLGE